MVGWVPVSRTGFYADLNQPRPYRRGFLRMSLIVTRPDSPNLAHNPALSAGAWPGRNRPLARALRPPHDGGVGSGWLCRGSMGTLALPSKLPAPKGTGVYGQGWKFTCVGHAPDLSKPTSFDYICNRLDGAWRIPFCLYSCKWPLIPGLKTGGFSAFITTSP